MACYVNKLQLAKIEKWTFPYYYIYVQNVFCFNVVDLSSFSISSRTLMMEQSSAKDKNQVMHVA